jgi:putative ABC transport system permease protein
VAAEARDRVIEPAGYVVGSIQIPGIEADPGQHWAQNQIHGFVLILQVMSVSAIFLSGGLVVNTISAILTHQVKQIGIMRSLGAVPQQIAGMYIVNVFIFSLLGLAIAIPIGWFGSLWLAEYAANFLNFDISSVGLFPQILLSQALLAFVVPIGVALYPIIAGTAISVYQAIYQHGLIQEDQKGWVEKLLTKISFLSPPSVLSLLNTFRNIPRLSFTLITLTLAGAAFVAAFSTRSSLNAQVKQMNRYVNYDVVIPVNSTVSRYTAEREAYRIPGVVIAEGWASIIGSLRKADGSEGEEAEIIGLEYDTKTMNPKMMKGRWLVANDGYQVVVNQDFIQTESVSIGDPLTVQVNGVDRLFTVVGITSKTLRGPKIYINYSTFSKLTGRSDQVDQVRFRTDHKKLASLEEQNALAALVEERFSNAGLSDSSAQTNNQSFGFFSEPFKIILMILLIMAGLLAVVGGLSLAGTMGINVMERTREIGVLRSVGASNKAVRQVIVVEGMLIAVLSWLLVVLISGPSSASLAGVVIYTVLNTRLTFRYSFLGLFLWLLIVAVIGGLSSLAPAQSAVTLTVREVLDYE